MFSALRRHPFHPHQSRQGNTYRILFSTPSKTGEVLRVAKGHALLDDDELVG